MPNKALVLPANEPAYETELPDDENQQLRALQDLVGGYIQGLALPRHVPEAIRAVAYVNDDGKHLSLPVNPFATRLMTNLMSHDHIAGTMVIAGVGTNGATVDAPRATVDYVLAEEGDDRR